MYSSMLGYNTIHFSGRFMLQQSNNRIKISYIFYQVLETKAVCEKIIPDDYKVGLSANRCHGGIWENGVKVFFEY